MSVTVYTELMHSAVPPSFNQTRYQHWAQSSKSKREWQSIFEALLMASGVARGPWSYVEAAAELTFDTRRRRDEGNYRTPIEKSLGDALVNGGWIADDTAEHFRFFACRILPDPGVPRTKVTLAFVGHG